MSFGDKIDGSATLRTGLTKERGLEDGAWVPKSCCRAKNNADLARAMFDAQRQLGRRESGKAYHDESS